MLHEHGADKKILKTVLIFLVHKMKNLKMLADFLFVSHLSTHIRYPFIASSPVLQSRVRPWKIVGNKDISCRAPQTFPTLTA